MGGPTGSRGHHIGMPDEQDSGPVVGPDGHDDVRPTRGHLDRPNVESRCAAVFGKDLRRLLLDIPGVLTAGVDQSCCQRENFCLVDRIDKGPFDSRNAHRVGSEASRCLDFSTAAASLLIPSSMRSGVDEAKHSRKESWNFPPTDNAGPGM